MKAFITLCTVLTVSLVLNVSINGVESARSTQSANGDAKPPASTTSTTTTSTKRSTTQKRKPSVNSVDTPEAATEVDSTDAAVDEKLARPRNQIEDEDNGNDNDNNKAKVDADEPLPTNVFGAGRRLVSSVGLAANRGGTDFLNGGAGLVRMGTGLGGLFSSSVARQANNVRTVATEGFGMANGFGDTLTRGTVKVMRGTSAVGREGAGRLSEVTDAAVEKGKKQTQFGGTVAKVPFKVGGDLADVGSSASTIPINLSGRGSKYMTHRVLPKFGADKASEGSEDAESG